MKGAYTLPEAAKELEISENTLRKYCKLGIIRAFNPIGTPKSVRYIPKKEVERFLAQINGEDMPQVKEVKDNCDDDLR